MNTADTLFYDGNCPLCMREVHLLERLANDHLKMIDLHEVPAAEGQPRQLEMLKNLYLRTSDGEWLTGVDATVRAWSHTRWGFLFKALRLPLIGALADAAYQYWARKRFLHHYGCSRCMESE